MSMVQGGTGFKADSTLTSFEQGLTLRTDKTEYSKYHPELRTIAVLIVSEFALESVISLERLDGYGPVSSKPHLLTYGAQTVSFDLIDDCKDTDGVNRAVMGDYVVRLVANNQVLESNKFAVSIVPIKELKERYCFGMTFYSSEILEAKVQPRVIKAVHIDEVSQTHYQGVHKLLYRAQDKALAWAEGEYVPVDPDNLFAQQLVLLDKRDADYIVVTVDPRVLPATDKTEAIIIERGKMKDEEMINWVRQASGWVQSRLHINLEPMLVDTDEGQFRDHSAEHVTYVRPRDRLQWLFVQLPVAWLLKVHSLSGWFNTSKTVDITKDWIVFDSQSGRIELVPRSGAQVSWQFYQASFIQFLFTYGHIPDFWHYRVTAGLPDLFQEREIIREAVAKRAAIDIMLAAGSAYRAGYSSESTSRDGVSSSQSYTSSAMYGVYSSQYEAFDKWLSANLPRMKQKFLGIRMVTL